MTEVLEKRTLIGVVVNGREISSSPFGFQNATALLSIPLKNKLAPFVEPEGPSPSPSFSFIMHKCGWSSLTTNANAKIEFMLTGTSKIGRTNRYSEACSATRSARRTQQQAEGITEHCEGWLGRGTIG